MTEDDLSDGRDPNSYLSTGPSVRVLGQIALGSARKSAYAPSAVKKSKVFCQVWLTSAINAIIVEVKILDGTEASPGDTA